MIDFDQLFTEYLQQWMENNSSLTPDEMEDKAVSLFDEWKEIVYEELGGISPKQYFEKITSPKELVQMLVSIAEEGNSPSALLLDRIAETDCNEELSKVINGDYSAEVKIEAINLLSEIGANHPLNKYVEILADENEDEGLRELCVEVMSQDANSVSEALYSLLPNAGYALKGLIAEILVNAKQDERTYVLLEDLFKNGNNVPLYAGFIGKYGDERAMMYLYKALDNCNYADFTEIRNAIEQLGGTVDDEYRDFSSDPYYKALKNLK
ncbi:MAG: hypothetical protein E7353_06455 [Clostridiales bacterium]|nr:hypothetical protein [Clostridiales bacterium]